MLSEFVCFDLRLMGINLQDLAVRKRKKKKSLLIGHQIPGHVEICGLVSGFRCWSGHGLFSHFPLRAFWQRISSGSEMALVLK